MKLSHTSSRLKGRIELPTSKSISNRLLVLQHLYAKEMDLKGISNANDSVLMQSLLKSSAQELDVEDAGTVMRFLLAVLVVQKKQLVLSGTARMHERPIRELVNALRVMGADISYLAKDGYPPLKINSFTPIAAQIDMTSVRSSQFISALLMILPALECEVSIAINSKMNSYSFVQLTLDLMQQLGFHFEAKEHIIHYVGRSQGPLSITVEKDWSSFYYWYAMAVISNEAELFFPGLVINGLQSESQWLTALSHPLISIDQKADGLLLKRDVGPIGFQLEELNFSNHPDLAPCLLMLFAVLGQSCKISGLESLNLKESKRTEVLQSYLRQLGGDLISQTNSWLLKPITMPQGQQKFSSYKDHRMAMSLAPLSLLCTIELDQADVVSKSYPSFWSDMNDLGFEIDTFAKDE